MLGKPAVAQAATPAARKTYGQSATPQPTASAAFVQFSGGDNKFIRVSGLFQSKDPAKSSTYTFFVSPEMADMLHAVVGGTKDSPGDMMGVSNDKKGEPYLWIRKK